MIAEIDSSKLMVCLEPEAASMYCRQIEIANFSMGSAQQMQLLQVPGTKFMVVDAGGKIIFYSGTYAVVMDVCLI